VVIVAVNDRDEVALVRRTGIRPPISSVGTAAVLDEPDEKPLEAAEQELFEEAGVRAAQRKCLLTLPPLPA
jgi:ADP-ribose pyrophosphatase YjhB (NUDIX family)